ncbi:unnamed protein product [Urochloa decumbens]|uniref:F-box domain-containing protein n=1 Tax=Urochloa decumbens TaxID=240449 RepID=A0ABC9DX26_9POAL
MRPPSSPLLATPLTPDAYQTGGIAWKVITMPFIVVGGGMDILLGTVRLSLWAVGRALSVMGLAWGTDQRLIEAVPESHIYAGDKARFLLREILFNVACRLRKSRRDVLSMRSVCQHWRSAVPNTNGPWLVLSRRQLVLTPGSPRITVLQMVKCASAAAAAADVAMAVVPCLSLPPSSATCWGAAHGLVALRQFGTNELYLFCLICGRSRILPPPPGEMIPHGIFFNERPWEPMATLTTNDLDDPACTLRLHFELTDLQDAQRHRWAMYPGTNAHDMRSLCFDDCVHFIGATSANTVVIDESASPRGHGMVFVDAPVATDGQMAVWNKYGHHVFKCSDNIYLCLLSRDPEDANVVSVQVFLLQSGYDLVPTNDIGSYAVYLGANKPVVLPAEDGSFMQRRNTIYVTDDDGMVAKGRVLSIDLSSREVSSIAFPNGVSMNDYGHASWVAAPPLDGSVWHTWHCNS